MEKKPTTVPDIIKTGVTGFLNKNKDINLGDLTSAERRKNAGDKLKNTFKSSALDTGQNIINHLRNEYQWEEVSRRKKPSAIKKKAKLNAALEKLKKVRGLDESRVMNSSSIEKSGPTIDVTATEVKDKKKGENAKKREKGGPITQKQNPRVGEPDGPDDKRTKRGERKLKAIDKLTDKRKDKIKSGLKTGAKVANTSAKVAGYVGSKAKSGISAFTTGYDANEEKTFSQYTEAAALALPLIPLANKAIATGAAAWSLYNMSKKKSPGQTNLFPKGSPENPLSNDKRSSSKRNQRISNKAQKSAEDKWRDDNNLGGTNVEPPWKGK